MEKYFLQIFVTYERSTMSVRDEHPKKYNLLFLLQKEELIYYLEMKAGHQVTEFGIVICFKDLHFLKAYCPILVTGDKIFKH